MFMYTQIHHLFNCLFHLGFQFSRNHPSAIHQRVRNGSFVATLVILLYPLQNPLPSISSISMMRRIKSGVRAWLNTFPRAHIVTHDRAQSISKSRKTTQQTNILINMPAFTIT